MSNSDYLKKYLSKSGRHDGKKGVKKKKSTGVSNKRCRIIDDDDDWKLKMAGDQDDDEMLTAEDTPTVVSMDEIKPDPNKYWKQTDKWKPMKDEKRTTAGDFTRFLFIILRTC